MEDVFSEEDVPNILAIPIRLGTEDTIAWHFDPKGGISVKLAYHTLDDEAQRRKQHQQG